MVKTIIVYYSRTGNTKKLSEFLAKRTGYDIEELIDTKSRKGVWGWIISGRDALKKNLTEIKKLNKDISKYDIVLVGTPNWGATIVPAVRTFLTENKSKIKKVAFFQTRGGENDQNVFLAMEEVLGKKPITTLGISSKEVKKGDLKALTKSFVSKIK